MFRIRLLKYFAQQRFTDVSLLQNAAKTNYTFGLQCISNINVAEKLKKPGINLQDPQNEETNELPRLTDKEYFIRLKNDPDKFGPPQEKEIIDEGDLQEEKFFTEQPNASQKLRTKQYADIIKDLIRQHKIKEAIDVVEVRMLKEDRVKPENYLYNLLLGACGRVGYTEKAFKLYNQMKKRGLQVTGGTYTALFNACSNSPWPTTDGLKRAKHLHNIMIEKGYEPNETNYNTMIKAYGRCGDLATAFTLVDEMYSKKIKIKDDTINFLLQACISDKDAGFRHALLVWRKLVNKKIRPNIYTYNLMLRCVRDCGLGDIEVTQDVINKILSKNTEFVQKVIGNNDKILQIQSSNRDIESIDYIESAFNKDIESNVSTVSQENTVQPTASEAVEIRNTRPNLMAKVPHLGNLISLSEVTKPEERLLLVGGCNDFLENMRENQCRPDIKTFTQLLDTIPSTLSSEKDLLAAMAKFEVKPDLDFYNMLIKRRSMRFDYESAKEVLKLIQKRGYKPNIMTYGVIALGCKNKEEALELIGEMKSKSYSLNIQILGAMLHQACYHTNFGYVLELMEVCRRDNVQPCKQFISTIEEFIKKCRKRRDSKELSKSQEKGLGILRARYKTWSQEVELDETEDVHPWQQYRQTNDQDPRHYTWKDGVRFKPRHTSKFRVKTSTKHRK